MSNEMSKPIEEIEKSIKDEGTPPLELGEMFEAAKVSIEEQKRVSDFKDAKEQCEAFQKNSSDDEKTISHAEEKEIGKRMTAADVELIGTIRELRANLAAAKQNEAAIREKHQKALDAAANLESLLAASNEREKKGFETVKKFESNFEEEQVKYGTLFKEFEFSKETATAVESDLRQQITNITVKEKMLVRLCQQTAQKLANARMALGDFVSEMTVSSPQTPGG